MSRPEPSNQHEHTEWQSLTEFLIPNVEETEVEIIDHVVDVLRQFNLDPGQREQILAAISQSFQGLEDPFTPLHLRISVSGVNLAAAWPETRPQDDPQPSQGSQLAGGGLGFFLVKRIVGQFQEQDPSSYRLVEVLLYRE